jgi:geranylgeranyl diphosphate synthase type II
MNMKNVEPNIHGYLHDRCKSIEKRLAELTAGKDTAYFNLLEATRYSLLAGGKRIRPLLVLATATALGGSEDLALDPACAVEMIHTYSLIHDDLPCMDNDDFRRGKPSLHKAFTEGHAVLTGDYLLTYAFEIIANGAGLQAHQKIELVNVIAKNAGAEGMIGGQIMDIESQQKAIDLHFLQDVHRRKTGALITACIECGVIIANGSPADREILKSFGQKIGLAFQIIDDVLDVTSNKNSDIKNHKTTYATLLGLSEAQELAFEYYQAAMEQLKKLPYDTALLVSLADLLVHRNC